MQQSSKKVISNQSSIHQDLDALVIKHNANKFLKPVMAFNQKAFDVAADFYSLHSGPLILDSGCGVGESTFHLAQQNPQHCIIGVDQSEYRISSNQDWQLPDNAIIIRADLIDFWRLALSSKWKLHKHYLLYPNPWPKKKHLQRYF